MKKYFLLFIYKFIIFARNVRHGEKLQPVCESGLIYNEFSVILIQTFTSARN